MIMSEIRPPAERLHFEGPHLSFRKEIGVAMLPQFLFRLSYFISPEFDCPLWE
jgi:hypothetical protein